MPKKLGTLLILAILLGFLTYKMFSLAERRCQLCIEFNGRQECPTALGPTEEEALDEAHRNACAMLANGVTEVLACNRVERTEIQCKGHL